MKKRILSILLCAIMTLSLLPPGALAVETPASPKAEIPAENPVEIPAEKVCTCGVAADESGTITHLVTCPLYAPTAPQAPNPGASRATPEAERELRYAFTQTASIFSYTLNANVDIGTKPLELAAGKKLTLDLKGHTITTGMDGYGKGITIKVEGELIIKDTGTGTKGSITGGAGKDGGTGIFYGGDGGSAIRVAGTNANLTIDGVTIAGGDGGKGAYDGNAVAASDGGDGGYAIYVADTATSATVTIAGGAIKGGKGGAAADGANGDGVIDGAKGGNGGKGGDAVHNANADANSKLIISGGTFIAGTGGAAGAGGAAGTGNNPGAAGANGTKGADGKQVVCTAAQFAAQSTAGVSATDPSGTAITTHKVTYLMNNGSGTTVHQTWNVGTGGTAPDLGKTPGTTKPAGTDLSCVGWADAAGNDATFSPINTPTSFYAVWKHRHDNVTFDKALTATGGALTTGNYYLEGDVPLTSTITIAANETVNLCLNGHKLIGATTGAVIEVFGTLNLYDCKNTTNTTTNTITNPNGSGNVTINGGVITGGTGRYSTSGGNTSGGGVYVGGSGNFTMHGGTIAGNSVNLGAGGGVYVGGSFTMNGGAISHNKSTKNGGGLCVGGAGLIDTTAVGDATLNGGTISNNAAGENGGAIRVTSSEVNNKERATLILSGTTIENNSATVAGAGIHTNGKVILDSDCGAQDIFLAGTLPVEVNAGATISATISLHAAGKTSGDLVTGVTSQDIANKFTVTGYAAGYTAKYDATTNSIKLKATLKDPIINAQPQSVTTTFGAIAGNLSVAATGDSGAVLSYKWQKKDTSNNWIDMGTGTNSFTFPTDLGAGTYTYRCIVTATMDSSTLSVTSSEATLTVNKAPLTVTVKSPPTISKVYDGNTAVTTDVSDGLEVTGLKNSETASASGTWVYDNKNVGNSKTVNITGITITYGSAKSENYSYEQSTLTTTGAITAKPITVAAVPSPSVTKVYDGGTTATVDATDYTISGTVSGETLTLTNFTATYNVAGVTAAKKVTCAGFTLADGTNGLASNYNLTTKTFDIAASITAKEYSTTGFTIADIPKQSYTNAVITPTPEIMCGTTTLTKGTDYTLSYTDNKAVGKNAKIKIAFTGNYSGSAEKTFEIGYATLPTDITNATIFKDYTTTSTTWSKDASGVTFTGNSGWTVGTDGTNFTNTITFTDEGDGASKMIYVRDSAGNIYTTTVTYKLDNTAPTLSGVTGNPSAWTKSDATLTVTATDTLSGVATVAVSDGTNDVVVTGTYQFVATKNGTYTITVTDKAGNVATQTVTVNKIDKTAPTITNVTGNPSDWTNADATIVFSATDTLSGVNAVTVSDVTAAVTVTGTYQFVATKNGTYTITVTDKAGNVATETVAVDKIDKTAPTITGVTTPSANWGKENETIGFTAADTTSDVKTIVVKDSIDKIYDVTASKSFVADKNDTYTITVTDNAGNVATETVTVNKIDNTAPTVSLSPAIDRSTVYVDAEITVTAADGANGSGVKTVTVSGGHFTNATDIKTAGKFTAAESTAGTYTYTVTVTDNAGNSAGTAVTITLGPKGGQKPVDPVSPPAPNAEIPKPDGGSVTISPENPKPGDKVSITAKPDEGKALDKITVTDKDGKKIPVTKNPDGSFRFVQPEGKVTISVSFKTSTGLPWNPFTDVKIEDWFFDSVKYVYENGLMMGTDGTSFEPDLGTSRAMIVTILWRMQGEPKAKAASNFVDVPAGAWFSEAVAWAQEQKLAAGVDEKHFEPNRDISRQELASLFYRYAVLAKLAPTGAWQVPLTYADKSKIAAWAVEGAMFAQLKGFIKGRPGNIFAPNDPATRAEASSMLQRFITAK